ncbi:DUF1828 domain-containing protein [Limosilactobacillus albertensis]|uniref:DUF1828 domain-containing protein n=1 Tax=Limosilactobacillus albertensis TaxID=2759752 RepID=A0A839HBM3_9LACO|nr:DUF1828 domain-containing protein [Limosilactobacillus albertensis]MBB1124339.1 DUF1828 domain-containing protein [Limosilactobacillus albertensis]MCD7122218.1 DUF1828 domain-containing protein [Limosilactobacillus albertensis]
MPLSTKELLNNYYRFLSKSYQINKLDDTDEIITPFTDNIGDKITLYLSRSKDNKIKLDDDGYTLDNLEMMNVNLSDARQQVLRKICSQYEVSLSDDGILYNTGTTADFPRMKLNITSAILKIGDLSFTQHSQVKKMFVDDVIATLNQNDLGGLPSYFMGRSGVKYNFPYVVAQQKTHPLKIVDVTNHINNRNIMQTAFQFSDIKNNSSFQYNSPKLMLIYNDKISSPSDQALRIAKDIGFMPMPFSKLSSIKKQLTA